MGMSSEKISVEKIIINKKNLKEKRQTLQNHKKPTQRYKHIKEIKSMLKKFPKA